MGQLINVLVTVMLVEMMAAIGLRVQFNDLTGIVKNWPLMLQAVLANYICVPAAAVALRLLFGAEPMVAAGFLILAVCPGAPFGPSCIALARGNVPAAVGLMAVLSGSSALRALRLSPQPWLTACLRFSELYCLPSGGHGGRGRVDRH